MPIVTEVTRGSPIAIAPTFGTNQVFAVCQTFRLMPSERLFANPRESVSSLRNLARVVIVIRERYTEDLIVSQFAKDFHDTYLDWLKDSSFAGPVAAFHAALARNGRHYVVNMAVADRHDPANLEGLANQGVIVPFEDPKNLEDLVDVLYQVRCNIFHGEKAWQTGVCCGSRSASKRWSSVRWEERHPGDPGIRRMGVHVDQSHCHCYSARRR